jgi:hypothetical protein
LNEYKQKKQNRIDRYRARADAAHAQSDSLSKQSHDMIHAIPMGQPIMSAADARYREKAGNKMRQAIAADEKAAYYERKAKAAENNTAISSDDPEAVTKLQEKLERLQTKQAFMKNLNAYYRKYGTCRGCGGITDEQADKYDQAVKEGPPWCNAPFESFMLSNNSAEIRRIEKRLKSQTEAQELGYTGWEFDGGRVEANADKNRLQVFFDEIPPEEVRKELKGRGFKWARSEGAWQRQLSDNAIYAASRIEAIKPADGSDPTKIQPKRKAHTGPTR